MLDQTQSSASGLLLQKIQEMRLGRAGCLYAFPSEVLSATCSGMHLMLLSGLNHFCKESSKS